MSDNEKRKNEFIRQYRAKIKTTPFYALKKLDFFDAVTEEDVLEAIKYSRNPENIRRWAKGNLGLGEYNEGQDQFVERGENNY